MPQPWTYTLCSTYVWWCHVDKKWPTIQHETHYKNNATNFTSSQHAWMKAHIWVHGHCSPFNHPCQTLFSSPLIVYGMIISTQCNMLQVHMVMTRNSIFGEKLDFFDYDINGVCKGGIWGSSWLEDHSKWSRDERAFILNTSASTTTMRNLVRNNHDTLQLYF
jgi:hypothetical protein